MSRKQLIGHSDQKNKVDTLLIIWKAYVVKNSYKSLALNNQCYSPNSVYTDSHCGIFLLMLLKYSPGLMYRAAYVRNLCILCHKWYSIPRYQSMTSALPVVSHTECSTDSWLLQVFVCRIPFTGVCCSTAWLNDSSTQMNFSYTDVSKSRTKAFKFHLAIFVFLNSPCAFFPLTTLCWLESDLIHKDICWQGQDKIAEFLSPHVTELSTKAYDCYLTKDP